MKGKKYHVKLTKTEKKRHLEIEVERIEKKNS
jgi:hypothetical protein